MNPVKNITDINDTANTFMIFTIELLIWNVSKIATV